MESENALRHSPLPRPFSVQKNRCLAAASVSAANSSRRRVIPTAFFLKPDDKNTIKIDAARKLIRWLNLQPVTSDRKIAIIDNCECLTPQATNALLKSVEEPGDSGIFILITSSPGSLLPTLQSRCQQLRFQPLAQDLIRHLLSAQEDWRPETLAAVLPIADGSLSQARLFGQWMESVESDLPALFFTLATQPYYRLVDCLAELPSETLGISCLLTGLRTVCRDLLILLEMGPAGTKRLLFPGSTKLCRNLGTHLQSTAIFQCIATLDEAQAALRQRSTANLIWESVAFSFQKMLKEKIPPSPPLQKGGNSQPGPPPFLKGE